METHLVPGARFVDPKVLARVKDLELLARTVVDGFINGLHRAPHFGASVDFAEHRGYVPGDDIRHVDWRLYARTDRYFIKQYEADTNASAGVSKLEYAKFLAACLAYLSHRQRDRVGIVTFDEEIVAWVPASAKHFHVLLHTVDRAAAERPGRLIDNLERLIDRFKRRSLVVLISDLYESPERLVEVLAPYRFGGHDLAVFHVLDPAEISFPYDEPSRFVDLESGEEMPVVPDRFAEEYRRLVREHIEALRARCIDVRIDYTLLETSRPLDEALFAYLSSRERSMRTR
jgi:uncharacterized protein (DUF58 family)